MSEMRLSETYLSEPKTNLQTRGLPFTADDRAAAFGLLPARVSRPWRVSSHPPSPLAAGIQQISDLAQLGASLGLGSGGQRREAGRGLAPRSPHPSKGPKGQDRGIISSPIPSARRLLPCRKASSQDRPTDNRRPATALGKHPRCFSTPFQLYRREAKTIRTLSLLKVVIV